MPSLQIDLPVNTWTSITTTDKNGQVFHQAGKGSVIYTESPTTPTNHTPTTPVSQVSELGSQFSYYGIALADLLWAYAISDNATLTVTPAEI